MLSISIMADSSASSAKRSFLGGLTGTLGVVVGIFILLLLCCVVGVVFTQMGDSENTSQEQTTNGSTESSDSGQAEPASPTQVDVLTVDTASFIKEFDSNQLASESKYEGKWLKFTGYIDNISEDILGTYFITLVPTNDEFYFGTSIQCYFENSDSLLSLSNGSQVTLQGKFDTQSFNILVKECSVVN